MIVVAVMNEVYMFPFVFAVLPVVVAVLSGVEVLVVVGIRGRAEQSRGPDVHQLY